MSYYRTTHCNDQTPAAVAVYSKASSSYGDDDADTKWKLSKKKKHKKKGGQSNLGYQVTFPPTHMGEEEETALGGASEPPTYSALQQYEIETQPYAKLRNPVNVLRDVAMRDSGVEPVNMDADDDDSVNDGDAQPALYSNTNTFGRNVQPQVPEPTTAQPNGNVYVEISSDDNVIHTGADATQNTAADVNPTAAYANSQDVTSSPPGSEDQAEPAAAGGTAVENQYEL